MCFCQHALAKASISQYIAHPQALGASSYDFFEKKNLELQGDFDLSNSSYNVFLGFTALEKPKWIRINITNDTATTEWILESEWALTTKVDAYIKLGSEVIRLPRLLHSRYPSWKLDIKPSESTELIMMVQSKPSIKLYLNFIERTKYDVQEQNEIYGILIFTGFLLALAFYNLTIGFMIKDMIYILYFMVQLSVVPIALTYSGIFNKFFPEYDSSLYHELYWFCTSIGLTLGTIFYFSFLDLKQNHPKSYRISRYIFASMWLSVPIQLFAPHVIFMGYLAISMSAAISIGIYFGYKAIKKGSRPAKFLFLAWGIQLWVIWLGFLDFWWGIHFEVLGNAYQLPITCADALILSLALAERISNYKRERTIALQQAHESELRSNLVLSFSNNNLKESMQVVIDNQKKTDRFIMNLGHELRTPLNAISASVDQLRLSQNNEEKELLESYIQSASIRLTSQVDNILILSETGDSSFSEQKRDFGLKQILSQVKLAAEGNLFQKEVTWIERLEDHTPEYFIGDKHLITRMLIPVIENASKYTETGEIEFVTSYEYQHLVFKISDTGPGMPSELIEDIFESFSQVSQGYQRSHEGLGLGLTVCKRISKIINAQINIDSEMEKGTCVTIKVPVTLVIKVPDKGSYNLGDDRFHGHALIVEDNPVNAKLLAAMANKMGLRITTAENGEIALAKVAAEKDDFDIILMDLQMPVMDGFTTTEILRKQGVIVPIIAVTANTDHQARIRCWDVGMNDFLAKPIKKETLFHTLKQWI